MLTEGGSNSFASEWVLRCTLKEENGRFLECRKPEVLDFVFPLNNTQSCDHRVCPS